jgi:hypothetical protein
LGKIYYILPSDAVDFLSIRTRVYNLSMLEQALDLTP